MKLSSISRRLMVAASMGALCACCQHAQTQPPTSGTTHATVSIPQPTTRIATTVHRMLEHEREVLEAWHGAKEAERIISADRSELDAVLDDAVVSVNHLPDANSPRDVFAAIEGVLVAHDFVLCIKTELLSDMLAWSDLSACSGLDPDGEPRMASTGITPARAAREAARRKSAAAGAKYGVHLFDCDLGSFIFVAVGERLQLPIHLVEIFGHNYVRWDRGATRVNWDVNDAQTVFDEDYATRWGSHSEGDDLSMLDMKSMGLMRSMSLIEMEGYHERLVADELEGIDPSKAIVHFRQSIALGPKSGSAYNDLAWLLAVAPQIATDGKESVELANRAIDIRNLKEWADTLSCARAAAGDFEGAIAIELKAHHKCRRVDRYLLKRDCRGYVPLHGKEPVDSRVCDSECRCK